MESFEFGSCTNDVWSSLCVVRLLRCASPDASLCLSEDWHRSVILTFATSFCRSDTEERILTLNLYLCEAQKYVERLPELKRANQLTRTRRSMELKRPLLDEKHTKETRERETQHVRERWP